MSSSYVSTTLSQTNYISSISNFINSGISETALQTVFTIWGYQVSLLELVAVVTSFIGVWLGTTGKKITWPWWAVSSLLYSWLFFEWKLYSSALLQLVFVAAAIWGWFGWGPKGAQPRTATNKQRLLTLLVGISFWVLLAPALASIGAAATWPDSFGLVFSVVAQVIMVREYTETWFLWFVVDATYTVLYATQGLWFTCALYVLFTLIAIRGWLNWDKKVSVKTNVE